MYLIKRHHIDAQKDCYLKPPTLCSSEKMSKFWYIEKSNYIMIKHSPILWWTFSSKFWCLLQPYITPHLLSSTQVYPLLPWTLVFLALTGFQLVNQWIDLEGQQSVLGSAKDPFSFHKQPPMPASPPASINISNQLLLTPSDSNTHTHLPACPLPQWDEVSRSPLDSYRWVHGYLNIYRLTDALDLWGL